MNDHKLARMLLGMGADHVVVYILWNVPPILGISAQALHERKHAAFWHQFHEKPSIIQSCPVGLHDKIFSLLMNEHKLARMLLGVGC